MPIEKGDIVKLTYTAVTESGVVFDTTDDEAAKANGIFDQNARYGPISIVVGQGFVVPGLDADLLGREVGEKRTLLLAPEEAFGPRKREMVETMAMKRFKEKPRPGERVQVENRVGTVESVVGGRARVDFNPPLAGLAVTYNYVIEEAITDPKAKVGALAEVYYGAPIEWSFSDGLVSMDVSYRLTFDQRWMLVKKRLADALLGVRGVKEVRFVEVHQPPKPAETPTNDGATDEQQKAAKDAKPAGQPEK